MVQSICKGTTAAAVLKLCADINLNLLSSNSSLYNLCLSFWVSSRLVQLEENQHIEKWGLPGQIYLQGAEWDLWGLWASQDHCSCGTSGTLTCHDSSHITVHPSGPKNGWPMSVYARVHNCSIQHILKYVLFIKGYFRMETASLEIPSWTLFMEVSAWQTAFKQEMFRHSKWKMCHPQTLLGCAASPGAPTSPAHRPPGPSIPAWVTP